MFSIYMSAVSGASEPIAGAANTQNPRSPKSFHILCQYSEGDSPTRRATSDGATRRTRPRTVEIDKGCWFARRKSYTSVCDTFSCSTTSLDSTNSCGRSYRSTSDVLATTTAGPCSDGVRYSEITASITSRDALAAPVRNGTIGPRTRENRSQESQSHRRPHGKHRSTSSLLWPFLPRRCMVSSSRVAGRHPHPPRSSPTDSSQTPPDVNSVMSLPVNAPPGFLASAQSSPSYATLLQWTVEASSRRFIARQSSPQSAHLGSASPTVRAACLMRAICQSSQPLVAISAVGSTRSNGIASA